MAQVGISPDVLEWARERAGIPFDTLAKRFRKYPIWLEGRGGTASTLLGLVPTCSPSSDPPRLEINPL